MRARPLSVPPGEVCSAGHRLSEHRRRERHNAFSPTSRPPGMDRYIVDDEEQLSPVVIATTAILVATFAVGIAYAAVGMVL